MMTKEEFIQECAMRNLQGLFIKCGDYVNNNCVNSAYNKAEDLANKVFEKSQNVNE